MIGALACFAQTWTSAPRDIRLLNIGRLARSVAQGLLGTDFVLYLRSLGWNGAAIGCRPTDYPDGFHSDAACSHRLRNRLDRAAVG